MARSPRQVRPPFFDAESVQRWLQRDGATRGMCARTYGKSLILGRKELDPEGHTIDDDRVKLTQERPGRYSVRVKDWRGRWIDTAMQGDLSSMLAFMTSALLHHLAAHAGNRGIKTPSRTSARRH